MNPAETPNDTTSPNRLHSLNYEYKLESLGNDYYDEVDAEEFPQHILRWRNNSLLERLGIDHQIITDQNFIDSFGKFEGKKPFLALRYHGYQFGEYNPHLGDGRGFLYGQVRGVDGELYDFGTKGSGRTPYSRGGDGMLTLKGGVREVLAGEVLHRLGVRTSRCLSMIETGLSLWRGDEPSPTRSSVMVRMSKSHIRFGTFERLHYLKRPDLIQKLLDHVIDQYYPDLNNQENKYALFYAELVKRVAQLVAQWMCAGFCHGVLNTDNMSITGESFDYGPYAFIPTYDLNFTAAYFDYYRRYCYGQQPSICYLNLELLQEPLKAVIDPVDLDYGLAKFQEYYHAEYGNLMLKRLGFAQPKFPEADDLLDLTIGFLKESQINYHQFFADMAKTFSPRWREEPSLIMEESQILPRSLSVFKNWCALYHQVLNNSVSQEMANVGTTLIQYNPQSNLLRPVIEEIWQPIVEQDNWQPFYNLIQNFHP